ncbi:MAG: hypothetical protein Q9187_007137 [Circinaria calcarea]
MNNDGGERRARDIEEKRGKRIYGKENYDSSDKAGKWCPHARFRLDGRPRERPGRGICSKKWSEKVSNPDCYHFLRGIDRVIVNSTKRLGDGNVLDQENNDDHRELTGEGLDDVGSYERYTSMLEAFALNQLSHQ